ncbi:unnamed protein product [Adineta steineri]|uniref:Tudor domain-containing protein n=1 Tax=Adineta steineri TaxID=433720 RepID=A0A813TFJ9_9BILA|nr:unnamed protein product [Adineta steineri]
MEKLEISTVNHHVGSTERVFVAHVNDLNDFYLHSDLERESLCKLGQDLYNEYSQSFTESSGINEIPNVGDYCACPSESEDWYRGLIRQIDHNNNAVVFKLDYGDVQCVPICFLRPLRKRFFHIHHLAFHCSLANLIRPVNGWSSDIIEEFRSRLTTTFLYAKFINYNAIRNISEVEITEKSSKIPLNKDFEQYQMQRSILQADDEFIYKSISMEKLDYSQLYQIRILYYISPSRFYVYLHDKLNAHMSFQKELQDTIQDCRVVSSPTKYQIVAVQDNCAIWHRAVIIDFTSDLSTVCVYFTDIGQKEYTSINNIRHLPEEFRHKPAFAIPCRLYQICSIDENNASIWKSDDPVHDEINRLLINNVACRICAKQDQICYDVEIEVPKVGDLSAFLIDKKLVSRTKMNPSQRPNYGSGGQAQQHSFVRNQLGLTGLSPSRTQQQQQPPRFPQPTNYPNNGNNMIQQTQTRTSNPGLYNNTVQQPPSASSNYGSSFNNSAVQPQNGHYIITQVHSALEFYGLPQQRVGELENVSKHFEDYYNNSMNDQSINVNSIVEGNIYVIQSGEKYHRAIIKHCESKSRVSVKLIDRGDEIIADSSELLQIERKYSLLPVFAQSFRLRNYDEAQSTANITRNLKKLILNQHVRIELRGPITNGFYPVEVFLNDNRSVNELLLSNDKNVTTPIANTKPTYNQPQHTHIESQVFSNSNKHHSTMRQDLSGGHFNMNQRTNDILPTPPRTLTGASRMQSGRFSGENQSLSKPSSSNEQMARFSSANNRNQQPQTAEPTWNNPKPTFDNNNMTNQQSFGRQPPGLSQFNNNQRMDDNKTSSTNRFPSSNYDNQQSSPSSGNTYNYDRSEKQTSAYNYQQNNDETNENNVRRSEFSSRGSSGNSFGGRGKDFSNQRGQSGFSNRNIGRSDDDNNNENSFQSSGGFSRGRPGGSGARGGARGGHFPERNGSNRNPGDDYNENSMQRSQNFSSNRGGRGTGGGFQNRRDQGNNPTDGDFGRRGGGFSTRGGQRGGERGGRGGFRNDRDRNEFQLNADNNSSSNTWSSMRPAPVNFEAGDRFIENEIPKEAFKFVISHIETANNVFIQLLSKGDDLTKLTDSLQSEYKQAPEVGLSLFKQNQPCLAKSSDGCWYRAIVLSTGLIKLNVRFVDFGDTTDVNASSIRQLAKKYCSSAPYAYPCTFKNVEVVKNVSTESIIDKCVAKEFKGKIETKNSDGKFLLESEEFVKMLLGINAIKVKSQKSFKLIKCIIVHIEFDQQRFFVQDDGDTIDKIEELIAIEDENSPTLSLDEVKQLEPNTKVIATFEEAPYRAIIQSDESEDNVNIFFIDYGNTSSSPKTSLKRCSEQLSSYPYQSKQCQLYGISSNEIDNAFKCLQEHLNETEIEIAIINEKDSLYNVLVYIDNECDDLTKLTDSLQSEYKQAPEVGLSLFKQNQACLAKSSDGCWYRAIVLSTGLIKLNVRFIDFGDTTDVNASSIRQLAKKYCSSAPYAYPCTFKNVEVVKSVSTDTIIEKCVDKEFKGKIETKNSDGKFLLESEEFIKMLLGINAIKLKSQKSFKLIKCIIVHIESDQQRFFVQDDGDTIDKIEELIAVEDENSPTLSLDEVKQLEPNTKVIATFEEAPYRAIIQSDESEDNVNIFFIDYGNTSSCPKTSLKRCSEQLSSYPYQSKQCQLYGISSNEIDNAFKCLQEHLNETEIEIAIVNEKDSLYNVLVYIDNECMNEKHGYDPNVTESNNIEKENNDQEQEQSLSVADHQTNDNSVTTNESITDVSTIVTPEQNVTETEETPSKYRQGLLTHIEQTKPYVYLQYIPESEEILEQINQLIGTITEEDKHNSSYEIGDHVIAQFSEDDNYYRARIESYCSTSKLYTVYFLDYGNIDTNVPVEHLYSYSNELEQIRPQAHGYVLDKISSETWQDTVRSFVEQNLNDVVEFYITDENHSSIQMKFDYENHTSNVKDNIEQTESLPAEPIKTITANISAIDNDYFYIHTIPDGNLHVCELEDILQSCEKQHNDQWFINDICIVSNEDEQYYRGQILSINDDKYTLKCIDYGNTLQNRLESTGYALQYIGLHTKQISVSDPRTHLKYNNIPRTSLCNFAIVDELLKTPSKYRQGLLTHIEQTKPYVYLQYIPESEEILEQINQLIGTITEEDKHNSSYEIGDHVIAQFSEDDNYYRARIESYCSTSKLYTVYFLDYGNIDTNVPIEHLYSYSNELEQIRPQAHGYVLDKISSETWQDTVRSFVEQNLNDVVEFYITDENHSSIQMKFDYENHTSNVKDNIEHTESLPTEPIKTITANISAIDNDYFYIHTIPDGNLHVCELEDILQSCEKQHNDQWFINDICIVSNEDEQYYRGQILSINDDKYTLKCIDYGNTLQNVTNEHLFKLPDENIYKQSPLAHQCRLYGIDDENQTKAIEELIKNIPLTEHVTITIENDRNNQCSYVTLTRENKDIVNNQYQCDNHENKPQSDNDENNEALLEKSPDSVHETDIPTINNEALLENSPDSVHETDIPTINNEALLETSPNSVSDTDIPTKNNEEEITSEIKPLDNDNPTSNNEAIHLNENEPSTAITDETNNSISSD